MITFLICFAVLVGAYFIYGRYLERTIGADPDREPPCRSRYDGEDYLPLPKWKTFLIQLHPDRRPARLRIGYDLNENGRPEPA